MPETLAVELAGRQVRIECDTPELAADTRERLGRFVLEPDGEPWLEVRAGGLAPPADPASQWLDVSRNGGGTYRIDSPYFVGELLATPRARARAEVVDGLALTRFLNVCLALRLPGERGLMLHADVVEVGGVAVAFAGHSGVGKSTAADMLARSARAPVIARDRAAVLVAEDGTTPVIAPVPRGLEGPVDPAAPRHFELLAILFPVRGSGLGLHRRFGRDAAAAVLRAALWPGQGVFPVEEAMEVAALVARLVPTYDLSFELGDDLLVALEQAGVVQ